MGIHRDGLDRVVAGALRCQQHGGEGMPIFQRDGIWWLDIRHSGRRIRRTTGTADKQAAQEYHDKIKAELWRKERIGERPTATWAQAVTAWWKAKGSKHKSVDTDLPRLRLLTEMLGRPPLPHITTSLLHQVRGELLDAGRSEATCNRYMALVSSILHYAHELEWIPAVPKIPKGREDNARIRWITREQADRLVAELPPHLALMAEFTLQTGLRRANVTGLMWSAVDLGRRMATVDPEDAKAGRAIGVPLNDKAVKILREARSQNGHSSDYVFLYNGEPVKRTGTAAWHKACTRAGIENFHWHDLRHTWASWHVMAGTPLHSLQKLGSWRSYDMVLRYAHLSHEHVAEHAQNLEDWTRSGHAKHPMHEAESANDLINMGWLMGLEPTTTGITIRDSTD